MRYLGRMLVIATVLMLLSASVIAAPQFSSISGQVRDADTGEPLVGAHVVLDGTSYMVNTDRAGRFRMVAVPDGSYTLHITYLGYQAYEKEITMSGGSETLDASLTSLYLEGEEVVFVGAQRSGQALALNQQRTSDNIVNIIAADQIGDFPDPNVTEAMQRVPGVAIQRDQGEGRYVTIRGTEPNLNNVMINGQRIPAPEGDVRSVALDVIPSDVLASIELNKALTPDMDGDAIGGSINLVTKSALDYDRPRGNVTLGGGMNMINNGPIGQGAFSYGRRMGAKNNIGVMLSGSYSVTKRGSENNEISWKDIEYADDGEERNTVEELELRSYDVTRHRAALGINIDYEHDENNLNYVRFNWNEFGDQEYRRRITFGMDDESYNTDGTVTGEFERDLKDRYEVQRIWAASVGGKNTMMSGLLDLDYDVSYSYAEEIEPEHLDWSMKYDDDIDFKIGTSDPDTPTFTPLSVSYGDLNNAANFVMDDVECSDNKTTDDELAFQLNAKYHLQTAMPAWAKVGAKARMKSKERANDVIKYKFEEDVLLSRFSDTYDADGFLNDEYPNYQPGLSVDPDAARDYWEANKNNSDVFEKEVDYEASRAESYEATENVYAGYLMGQVKLNPRLMLLAGARIEMTDIEYDGFKAVFDDEGDFDPSLSGPVSATNDYMNVLPSLHLRYAYDDRINFRLAVTQSLARPDYYDLVPYIISNSDDEEYKFGNPELDPAFSTNIDLMGEYYFSSVGIVSAGFFMKSIDNYLYTKVWEGADEWEYSQPVNADETATLYGFEIAYNQQLHMLPGWASGFGIYSNYTYTTSTVDLTNEDGDLRESVIPGQSEHIGNFALGYEKFGFSARLSMNYRGKQVLEVGKDEDHDIWLKERMQLDFNASYRIWKTMQIYMDMINILNQPYVVYEGDEDHPVQREFYRPWGHIGVKYTF